jgi:hypothetical protein
VFAHSAGAQPDMPSRAAVYRGSLPDLLPIVIVIALAEKMEWIRKNTPPSAI